MCDRPCRERLTDTVRVGDVFHLAHDLQVRYLIVALSDSYSWAVAISPPYSSNYGTTIASSPLWDREIWHLET